MSSEVADLYMTLRSITVPFTEGLVRAGVSATELIAQLADLSVAADRAGVGLGVVGREGAAGGTEAAAAMERAAVAADGLAVSLDRAAVATKASSGAAREAAASQDLLGNKALGLGGVLEGVTKYGALGLAGVSVEAIKMASTFQSSTTRLVTSAGESNDAISMVRNGMLSMAGQVGVKADELSQAMYYVEAAGYHAADGLTVLKASAQGAAAEGADTTTVAKALTDVLVDYHLKATDAANVTSQMIAAVAHGKTNLQDFSASFASIVPAASAAGISFEDVMAALSNMTNHGFTAQRASQNLAQALRSLLNPTNTMYRAFQDYGLSSDVLKEKLAGPNGLTDAMEYVAQAATKAGPEGTTGYAAALKAMMGTAPGANAALATTGQNFQATADTIKAVGSATADASGKVAGFALVQQTLGQQLGQLRAGFDSVMIRLGDFLIPQVSKFISLIEGKGSPVVHGFVDALRGISQGFTGHTQAAEGKTATSASGEQHGGPVTVAPLTPMQELGKTLRGVSDDIGKFVDAGRHLADVLLKEVIPQVEKIGGAAIVGGLTVVGQILANVVAPAMKDFADFAEKHKTIMTWIIDGFLIPLTLRLTLLATVKTVSAIGGLARDIVSFPFSQGKQILDQLGEIKTSVSGSKAASVVQSIGGGLKQAGTTIASTVAGWGTSIGSAVKNVMPTKLDAQLLLQSVKDKGSEIGTTISGWASSAVSAAQSVGSKVATGLSTGMSTLGAQTARIWQSLGSAVASAGTAAKGAVEWLVASGKAAYEAGVKAAIAAGAWLAEKVQLLATAVAEGLAAAGEWLLNVALDANPIMLIVLAIAALVGAIIYAWTHFAWFRTAVLATWELIGGSALWLWHQVLEPMFHGIAAAAMWLWREVFVPAFNGIWGAVAGALGFVSGLPGELGRIFSGAEHWLVDIGGKIIGGLLSGIKSGISSVKNTLTGLTKDLTSWKGPPEKDAVLLRPAGQLIISGLIDGIKAKTPDLKGQLTSLTGQIAGLRPTLGPLNTSALAIGGSAGMSALAVGSNSAVGAGGGQLQPIVVNVDGRKLFEVMQVQALRNNRRNPTSGLALT